MNKKGITLIEIIVSISLISVVMVFLLNLFISIRSTYYNSKLEIDYELITAAIIKSIGDDIEDYGLLSAKYTDDSVNNNEVILTYNAYRPSNPSEKIQKVLKVTKREGDYYISYAYDYNLTKNITKRERMTNISRLLPKDVILNEASFIDILPDKFEPLKITPDTKALEIKIPIQNSQGTDYSINIYSLILNEEVIDS